MSDYIAPEEKLLRLIRGQKPKQNIVTEQKIENAINDRARQNLPFPIIHKIIWLVFILSCLYLAFSFIQPAGNFTKLSQTELSKPSVNPEPQIDTRAPYDFYAESIKGRKIFTSTAEPELQKQAPGINKDIIKDITLVGVITGDNPQAVIEDKKAQKSYYLNKGQFIGELQVLDIQEGKIILDYQGQKFELYL